MGMKANTHLEVPPVNWAIIHSALAGSSLLPLSQNQQQPSVGEPQRRSEQGGPCAEVGLRRAGQQRGNGPLLGGSAWPWRWVGKPRGPGCGEVLGKHMWGPGGEGEAAALEHHENPSQPVLGFIRSVAGRGVGEGSPGPAVLCSALLLVNSGFAAISAWLPPEQGSGSPCSPFPSLLLPFLPPLVPAQSDSSVSACTHLLPVSASAVLAEHWGTAALADLGLTAHGP